MIVRDFLIDMVLMLAACNLLLSFAALWKYLSL